jgi:hypothetical protein
LDRGRDEHTALCQTLLVIWERWTDGNLAMRGMLECESADPRSYTWA